MNFDNIGEKIIKSVPLTLECYFVEKCNKEYVTGDEKIKNRDLLVLKMRDYKTHKHVFSQSIWGCINASVFEKYRDERKSLKFKEVHVKLERECVYKYTWGDVNDGKCEKEKLNEIQRDDDGNPVFYTSMVVYVCAEGYPDSPDFFEQVLKQNCYDVFEKHYVEKNDSLKYLNSLCYINSYDSRRETEKKRIAYEKEMQSEGYYQTDEGLVLSLLDSVETERYDMSDMSEEDAIMDALENGDAEKYGF